MSSEPTADLATAVSGVASAPDGVDAARGWLVVGATFASTFTVFGVAYSFGAFFDSMAEDFGTGKGATALMFSLTTCWYFMFGLATGKAADRWGPRPVLVVAAVSLGVGLMATSRVQSIWVGYLTYGIGAGTAVACAYVPMVAVVGGWFLHRRAAALGVAVSGIGAGTLALAPISERLIDAHGWRTAYVVLGVGGAVALLVAALGAHRPPQSATSAPIELGVIARDPRFLVVYGAIFLMSLTLFIPFVFVKDYAEERGVAPGPAATLVGLIGAASIAGRLGLGALGNRVSALHLTELSFAMVTVSFPFWLATGGNYALLVVFTLVLGVGYGGFIALTPAVVASQFGTAGLGTILGALYTAAGVGGLIGPPLAGELIDRTSYGLTVAVATIVTAASTGVICLLPSVDRRLAAARS